MTSTTPTSPVLNGAEAKLVDGVAKQLFIDGCWVDASGGATFDVLDPWTGQELCEVASTRPRRSPRPTTRRHRHRRGRGNQVHRHRPACLPAPDRRPEIRIPIWDFYTYLGIRIPAGLPVGACLELSLMQTKLLKTCAAPSRRLRSGPPLGVACHSRDQRHQDDAEPCSAQKPEIAPLPNLKMLPWKDLKIGIRTSAPIKE
jgi:hypothetical protein